MLGESKLRNFLALVKNSSESELAWMSGYLSALVARPEGAAVAPPAAASHPGKITIVYGTETGNSKKLATTFASRAKKIGINAKVVGMDQYKVADLQKEEYFFPIVSTHGEGDPPAAAKKFYDHIHQNGFKLSKLKYGVLALGDTSYPLFCKTGEDVDVQLQKLGGERIVPLQKLDIDFEAEAGEWFERAIHALSSNGTAAEVVAPSPVVVKKTSGRKVHHAKVLASVNLNDRGSKKITQHIELSADEVVYEPGDSIGVIPENPVKVVEEILATLSLDHQYAVQYKNESVPVFELLQKRLNIFYLPQRVVSRFGDTVGTQIIDARADLLDLLKRHPLDGNSRIEELVGLLEPIAPRLYSISSSPEAHSGEIHITVAKNNYTIDDELKYGLTSDFLCQLAPDDDLNFYIHPNAMFRLPEPDKDIIMIGPGTGIAPFRSFIAHRDATGASGKNWLFFGEQHFVTDFLYQTEIQSWLETGTLTKISVAFSRDQQEKIYVQHKMLKEAAAFFEWLEAGACVYVCGTKDPMSIDVENALITIISTQGNRSQEEAYQYLDQMKEDGRYLKDVY